MAAVAKVVCLLVAFMVVAAPTAEAVFPCGSVFSKLTPCLAYLRGGPGPTSACCGGVKALNAMAHTPQDRKAACGCLKSTAGAISGINYGNAASLPGKCGVRVPYPISPKTDCSKVH